MYLARSSCFRSENEYSSILFYVNASLRRYVLKFVVLFITGHCAKLEAIINRAVTDPRAVDKLWLVVLDDDTIMRYQVTKTGSFCFTLRHRDALGSDFLSRRGNAVRSYVC